jgi:hypothetical protein
MRVLPVVIVAMVIGDNLCPAFCLTDLSVWTDLPEIDTENLVYNISSLERFTYLCRILSDGATSRGSLAPQ